MSVAGDDLSLQNDICIYLRWMSISKHHGSFFMSIVRSERERRYAPFLISWQQK